MSIDGGLRQLFPKHIAGHWQSIESLGTGGGTPDVNFCTNGVEGWIEYKTTGGWRVSMRPLQPAWIERRVRNGGRVFIAVRARKEGGRKSRDELWLIAPSAVRLLVTESLLDLPPDVVLCRFAGGPARWDWTAVANMLVAHKN